MSDATDLQQRFAGAYDEPLALDERLGRVLRADTQALPAVVPPEGHPSWALLIERGATPDVSAPPGAELDLSAHAGAGAVLLGRDPGCAIVLADATVSRRHARLVVEDDICRIEDLGSTNGTFANGRAVTTALLREGDAVTFGMLAVRLRWAQA